MRPGHSVLHCGVTQFTNTGGTEGPNGAAVWVTPTTVHKLVDNVVVYGSGFASFEFVTVWIDFADSGCATMTLHSPFGNSIDLGGISTFALATVKADAAGTFSSEGPLGQWWMTCRGDSSGATGIAPFTLVGGIVDP